MDDQGTEIFVGIYKAIKRDSVFKKNRIQWYHTYRK